MMTTYILVLVASAGLIAFGFSWLRARLAHALKRPLIPQGTITLGVTLAMLIVVAAPAWLFAALIMLMLTLHQFQHRLPLSPIPILLLALLPLAAAPLAGASSGFALDAALIAACLFGETYAS